MIVLPSGRDLGGVRLEDGVPSPFLKWAEEGYTVVAVCLGALEDGQDGISLGLEALSHCKACHPRGKVGLVSTLVPVDTIKIEADLLPSIRPRGMGGGLGSSTFSPREIVGVVVYGNADSLISNATIPMLQHLAGASASAKVMPKNSNTQGTFDYTTEAVSHTRNLAFLRPLIGGPYFDLETIWEEHTQHEFETRSVPHTMATMVQEPYVNHIPTVTGGIGRAHLSTFYQNYFIFNNPADAELELISRALGIDRVVDEFIYKFTHDTQIDWLLPGIPPTSCKVEIPFTAIVNIRGDRLYHKHIAWDQMTALIQVGLIPEYLPWTYPAPYGTGLSAKAKLENRVPGAGRETAEKMRDKNAVESNQLFRYGLRVVGPLEPLSPSQHA